VYVSERAQARKVFVEQLPATLTARALDAKVQVSFDSSAVRSYRLIGYENRAVADEDFRNDRVDGGEVGPGHSVTALYEVRLNREVSPSDRVARVQVRWLDPTGREPAEAYESVSVADIDGDFARARPELWVCYAAGYLAEALRGGRHADRETLRGLADMARAAYERTDDRAVRDLADLIDRARDVI
jgi:Ca-activated chloride channel family protein